MKCREITEILERDYPGSCAEEWDNVGLLAGDYNSEIKSILVALDATDETIDIPVAVRQYFEQVFHWVTFMSSRFLRF